MLLFKESMIILKQKIIFDYIANWWICLSEGILMIVLKQTNFVYVAF